MHIVRDTNVDIDSLIEDLESKCDNVDMPPGWRTLVAHTHWKLTAIDPDYKLIQIREKFSALKYNAIPTSALHDVWRGVFFDVIDNAETNSLYTDMVSGDYHFARFKRNEDK